MLAPFVLVAASYAGTLELGDFSEVRGRITTGQNAHLDAMTQLRVRGRITDRRWDFVLGYVPSLTLQELESGVNSQNTLVFQTGSAALGWHDRLVRLTLSEDATYGLFNSAYLVQPAQSSGQTPAGPTSPTPTVQLAAAPQPITVLSTRTALTMFAQTDRRASLALGVAWITSGSLDHPELLPEQSGPRADGLFTYALSRRDQALTIAYAQRTDFTSLPCISLTGQSTTQVCEPQDQIVQASEGIRHAITRATTLTVSAGAAVTRIRSSHDVPYHEAIYANGDASLAHRFGPSGTMALFLGLHLAPLIDARTGIVTDAATAQASLDDRVNRTLTIRTTATALQTIPPSDPLSARMLSGAIEFDFDVNREVQFAAGARGIWQEQNPFGTFLSAIVFFDVTLQAPALRF